MRFNKFKIILMSFIVICSSISKAENEVLQEWLKFDAKVVEEMKKDRIDGISQIISGSLALVGGIYGDSITSEPVEKAVYTVFQSVGVASIGFGVYQWNIGGADRKLHQVLKNSDWMSNEQRGMFLTTYNLENSRVSKSQNNLRALTHGLIALVNIYNGSRQHNASVKNSLYFIGGVNAVASIAFAF